MENKLQTQSFNKMVEMSLPDMSIGELVDRQATVLGDKEAIFCMSPEASLTYEGLAEATNRVGNLLLSLGIGKGDRVAIMLPNILTYPVIWLALAKIGAVHVPVNTRYTPPEISFVVKDSGASLAIVHASFIDVFMSMPDRPEYLTEKNCLVVDQVEEGPYRNFDRLAQEASASPCRDETVGPEDLLNIQYTSGTTGFPKGCMLTQDYWMVLAHSARNWDHQLTTRILSAQPYFYMDPQWITLKALMNEATLVMAPGLSSRRFAGWLKKYRIDWCMFPILMTRQGDPSQAVETSLKQVATFGWPPETCRDFKRRFDVPACEGFGMTEIGLGTWMLPVFPEKYDSGSVGYPAPFRETSIRDSEGQPVPTGETGELWVRGRSIFQGYWNRPKVNEEAIDDRGWFKTGDLFREDADGALFLVGRLKDMIRRSQENIAAREVEAALCELPEIEDAACVPVPDPVRGEEVKAYIQLKPEFSDADCPPQKILDHAYRILAPFKVPRYIAYEKNLPRTASNKVAKNKLIADVEDLAAGAFDSVSAIVSDG